MHDKGNKTGHNLGRHDKLSNPYIPLPKTTATLKNLVNINGARSFYGIRL